MIFFCSKQDEQNNLFYVNFKVPELSYISWCIPLHANLHGKPNPCVLDETLHCLWFQWIRYPPNVCLVPGCAQNNGSETHLYQYINILYVNHSCHPLRVSCSGSPGSGSPFTIWGHVYTAHLVGHPPTDQGDFCPLKINRMFELNVPL